MKTLHDTDLGGEIEIDWPVRYEYIPAKLTGHPDTWHPAEEDFECLLDDRDLMRLVMLHALPMCRELFKQLVEYRDFQLIKDVRYAHERGEEL